MALCYTLSLESLFTAWWRGASFRLLLLGAWLRVFPPRYYVKMLWGWLQRGALPIDTSTVKYSHLYTSAVKCSRPGHKRVEVSSLIRAKLAKGVHNVAYIVIIVHIPCLLHTNMHYRSYKICQVDNDIDSESSLYYLNFVIKKCVTCLILNKYCLLPGV